jgi:AAA+ ATPase superfamily predicted ATPase
MSKIIGRKPEIQLLKKAVDNNRSELIAVYGRRRVGKTFLIREYFKKDLVFELTGLSGGSIKNQLENFNKEILHRGKAETNSGKAPTKWFEAFTYLENYLATLKTKKKKVVFIDEFPWIATPKSDFLVVFENFWNNYCTKRDDLIVVICGSSASYMVKKIINNKKGLHNRITQKIRLLPFTIHETDLFLKSRGINYTTYDTIQVYMSIGGVPHYLEKLQKGLSVAQNLDELCFDKNGLLHDEFNQLYASLFDDSEKHLTLIKTLAKLNKGITRNELIEKSGISSSGDFTLKLNELIESGFVSESPYYQNKKQLSLFRLSDEYSKFYLKFIDNTKNSGAGTWQRLHKSQSYVSWAGFAFEALCLKHIPQLKKALKIDAIYSISSSWFNKKAQIDLLIDRDDNIVNLCELKFYASPYTMDKSEYLTIKNKIAEFQQETKTRKNIFVTMVTSYGIKENQYSKELIQNDLTIDCFFLE